MAFYHNNRTMKSRGLGFQHPTYTSGQNSPVGHKNELSVTCTGALIFIDY